MKSIFQLEPEKRLSWEQFFHHPLFSAFSSSMLKYNNILNDKDMETLSVISKILSKVLKVDKEFNQNKENLQGNNEFMNDDQLVQYGQKHELISKKVEVQPVKGEDTKELIKNTEESELHQRYTHEKNKIFFIIVTIKKCQSLVKEHKLTQYTAQLGYISLLLIKKANVLNELNLLGILHKKNLFQLNQETFERLLEGSGKQKFMDIFILNREQIRDYITIIEDRLDSQEIPNPYGALIQEETPDLKIIDNEVLKHFKVMREGYKKNEVELPNTEAKRQFLLFLLNIYNAVFSEKSFPFICEGNPPKQMNWNQFYIDWE